jgi:hypothetical protein
MRFRKLRGEMLVVAPDSQAEIRDVEVLYDSENDCFGVQLVGESVLKGYCFFVPRKKFSEVRLTGEKTDRLQVR